MLASFMEGRMLARFDSSKDAAVLSSLGASKGGEARAKSLTPRKLSQIAKKAANTRWAKSKGK